MSSDYVYRTYHTKGTTDSVREKLTESLLSNGYQQTGNENNVYFFRYPSFLFSSKRPLTCVSRLSLEVTENDEKNSGKIQVKIGANFTKIRYFTISLITVGCFILPAVLGYIQRGMPDIPPMAYLGIPVGFMLHYHVRWRVFKTLRRLIVNIEEKSVQEKK